MRTARYFFFSVALLCVFSICTSKPQNLILLCAGDSITESSYPRHLQRLFEAEGIRAKVYNFGRSGNTTGEYLEFLKQNEADLKELQPDFILLQLGTNDVRMDHDRTTGDAFYINMKSILSLFRPFTNREGKKSRILLALIPPVPHDLPYPFSSESCTRVYEEINPIITKIAVEEKMTLVDNYSLFIRSPRLLAGIHPTEEGYKKLARNWYDSLLSDMK